MKDRIKEIRKHEGYTQSEFATKLGISFSNIQSYEVGRRIPSDAFIKLLCNKYNVNEIWLRTGEGDMFNPLSREEEIALLINKLASDEDEAFRLQLIKIITNLTSDQLEVIKQVAIEIAKENSPK